MMNHLNNCLLLGKYHSIDVINDDIANISCQDLKEYFSNESWYKPAENNDNIKLSFVEQLNLELIKSVEDEKVREAFQ